MVGSRLARSLRSPLIGVALAALALGSPPVAVAQGDDRCLSADLPPIDAPARPLRFGMTPGAAGTAGPSQGAAAPENRAAAIAALQGLESPGRELVLRLNRLFWADGDEGIRRFAAMADEYGRAGLASEIQVRYHPPEGAEGDIDRWEGFVRRAVRELGPRPAVAGFSITNEANFPLSPNTSDGAYDGVIDALVRGVAVAHEELVKLGRPDLPVGFNVAWRYTPDSDARFWTEIGRKATPAFRRGLGYVGLQVYPGLVWPPAERLGVTAGEEVVEALTLIRRCYMPKAGLGNEVDLWVSENGYATNQGRSEPRQAARLDSTVRDVHRWSGTLGVTDYRYFNLRDNDSDGDDLFDAVGLLRDDYAPKPAYALLGGLIGQLGREAGAEPAAPAGPGQARRARPRVAFLLSPRADLRGRRRFAVRGRLLLPAAVLRTNGCRGTVVVRYAAGRRTVSSRRAAVRSTCRFSSTVTFSAPRRFAGRRRLRVSVRFEGNASLRAASARARSARVR